MTKLLTAAEARELLENDVEINEYIKSEIMPGIRVSCTMGLSTYRHNLENHIKVNFNDLTESALKISNKLKSLGYTVYYGSNSTERFMYIKW